MVLWIWDPEYDYIPEFRTLSVIFPSPIGPEISSRSEVCSDFGRKTQMFPTTSVFIAPVEGLTVEILYRFLASKNYNNVLTR